jgi:hypothetical protein
VVGFSARHRQTIGAGVLNESHLHRQYRAKIQLIRLGVC